MHRPSPFLQPLQKNTYHLPCSPLPLHRILSPSQPLQKDNNPSPRTKLASLVKGRWIDGKAQTVALLRPACDMSALFILQTFLPSRRRDCSAIFHSEPTLPKPHYPSKIANTLATLVKGRWIDGKAQTVALLRLNCDTPALFITKPFCRQDGGIVTLTLALHQPFPNPHYPIRFSCCEFDSPTSRKNKIRPRFHGGELIKSLIYKY